MNLHHLQYLRKHGYTFERLAKVLGRNKLWVAAAFMNQARFSADEAEKLRNIGVAIDLEPYTQVPTRSMPARAERDPFLYRLNEMMYVYGMPIKAIVTDKLGDGILSAVDCKIDIQEKEENGAKRVVLMIDSKFLPYVKW